MTTVTVEIENTYSDGHESRSEVTVPAPTGDLESWWQETVFDHTGDGHGADHDVDSLYTATITASADPALIGLTMEWG